MSSRGTSFRLLASLLRLVVFALVVGVVVAALLPGGPIDLGLLDDRSNDDAEHGTPAQTGMSPETTTTPPDRPRGASPWGKEVLVVAIRNEADPSRNLTGPVADALVYWEENIGYADYPARFRLRPDAADADVVVWYNASIECPAHHDAIGCAPLIEASGHVDPPVNVQIRHDPSHNRRQVRNTAIHELGHVLGVTHCEEPHWAMGSSCSEPLPDAPDATERALAWRENTLTVYVDDSNVSEAERSETGSQVEHALAYFENASEEEFPGSVEFVRVEDRFSADVSVVFAAGPACSGEAIICYTHRGRDHDGDGALEYHTAGTVYVEPGTDVEARGWYVGWGLANLLSPGDPPPVFEDASHRERRGEWWE